MSTTTTRPAAEIEAFAAELEEARRSRTPVAPLTERQPDLTVADAYAIQSRWAELRRANGDKVLGRKIGLTSVAVQQQLGVSEPDYGDLWSSDFYETQDGEVTMPASRFVSPRMEAEVAFLFRDELKGPGVTTEQVIAATEACALAIEIADSRVADWKIKLPDTVADNASFGGYAVGQWDRDLPRQDLSALEMKIERDGEVVVEGTGQAVMGSPAISATWLVNKLGEFGVAIKPGDVVISGALTKMIPSKAGDTFTVSLTGQPDLTVRFV